MTDRVLHLDVLNVADGKLHAEVFVAAFISEGAAGFEWNRSEGRAAVQACLWMADAAFDDAQLYFFSAYVTAGATNEQVTREIHSGYFDHCTLGV